jgi:lipoprotein NlpD
VAVVEANLVRRLQSTLTIWALGAAMCLSGCAHASRARNVPLDNPVRRFSWPVPGGVLSSRFGIRNGVMHDGVDISAPAGTPVRAADLGVVIFSGRLRGYGNVVILRHDDHYVTVYAHNRINSVREGDRVGRGQIIAEVGTSGRTTGPNLHFEVRHDNLAQNPLNYLLAMPAMSGQSFARSDSS